MTAILEELRRLDSAAAKGEITADALRAAKARLVEDIEEAEMVHAPTAPGQPREQILWHVLLFCFGALAIATGIATVLLGDLTLALTCTLTLLAAFTVHAFRTLDD